VWSVRRRRGRGEIELRKLAISLGLILATGGAAMAAQMQGLLVAQSCVEDIVKNGHEATLQKRPGCSLQDHYVRTTYALVTDSKRYFTFDPYGNEKAQQVLAGSPNRDELKVVVTGEVNGDTIKVKYMTIL
jgi:hypothetical protein